MIILQTLALILTLGLGRESLPNDSESVPLTFGVYQSDKATKMYKKFLPAIEAIQDDLEKNLGRPVDIELKIFKTYDEGLDALVKGKVDFVRFGPAPYILARERNPDLQLLAMELKKGKKRFSGMIVVKADSHLKTLDDIKGERFAFGDENSTIGRYLAQAMLVDAGIRANDLAEFDYLGRHDKVARAVQVGDFAAGSIKSGTFNDANKKRATLRTIARFDNVTKPWVACASMDKKVAAALQKTLIELKDKDALKALKVSGFSKASDKDYDLVRKGMKSAKDFKH